MREKSDRFKKILLVFLITHQNINLARKESLWNSEGVEHCPSNVQHP